MYMYEVDGVAVWTGLVLLVVMCGKFAVTAIFNMMHIFASEMYPTSVRTMGLSVSSFFARLGSMLAPLALELVSPSLTPKLVPYSCKLKALHARLCVISGRVLPRSATHLLLSPLLLRSRTLARTSGNARHDASADVR